MQIFKNFFFFCELSRITHGAGRQISNYSFTMAKFFRFKHDTERKLDIVAMFSKELFCNECYEM